MIEIKHRGSGRAFLSLEAESLVSCNLAGEYLIHADFRGADLRAAMLGFANLSGADLSGADLRDANFRGANLTEVDLTDAELRGANLAGATMSLTVLAACRNLHEARGLELIRHPGPSLLDEQTIHSSLPGLPDNFLRGVGYTRSEIVMMRRDHSRRLEP